MTSKERAYLRGLANTAEPLLHIGKQGVTPEITNALNEALEARELVKISVLQNCDGNPAEIAETLAGRTHSETVQVIGKKIVLYKKSNRNNAKAAALK